MNIKLCSFQICLKSSKPLCQRVFVPAPASQTCWFLAFYTFFILRHSQKPKHGFHRYVTLSSVTFLICFFRFSRGKNQIGLSQRAGRVHRSTFTHQKCLFFSTFVPSSQIDPSLIISLVFPSVLPRFTFFCVCTLVPLLFCPREFPRPAWVTVTKKNKVGQWKGGFTRPLKTWRKNTLTEIKEDGGRREGGNK